MYKVTDKVKYKFRRHSSRRCIDVKVCVRIHWLEYSGIPLVSLTYQSKKDGIRARLGGI